MAVLNHGASIDCWLTLCLAAQPPSFQIQIAIFLETLSFLLYSLVFFFSRANFICFSSFSAFFFCFFSLFLSQWELQSSWWMNFCPRLSNRDLKKCLPYSQKGRWGRNRGGGGGFRQNVFLRATIFRCQHSETRPRKRCDKIYHGGNIALHPNYRWLLKFERYLYESYDNEIAERGSRCDQLRFDYRILRNKAGYTAQDAPSTRLKITRDGRTYGPTDLRTDGPTDGHTLI